MMYYIRYKEDDTFLIEVFRYSSSNVIRTGSWTEPGLLVKAKFFNSIEEATNYVTPIPYIWLSELSIEYIHSLNFSYKDK